MLRRRSICITNIIKKMYKKILVLLFLFFPIAVSAQKYVNGYHRKDGTYVQGYYRSERNGTNRDNWSTKGNYNPYTGSRGTKVADYSEEAFQQNYNRGKKIYTGPKGGEYYINRKGNKTYVPKTKRYK